VRLWALVLPGQGSLYSSTPCHKLVAIERLPRKVEQRMVVAMYSSICGEAVAWQWAWRTGEKRAGGKAATCRGDAGALRLLFLLKACRVAKSSTYAPAVGATPSLASHLRYYRL